MELKNKFSLCSVKLTEIHLWLKENNLLNKHYTSLQQKWNYLQQINFPFYFSNTVLLVAYQDIILLEVKDKEEVEFLTKTYSLDHQKYCQQVFGEKKNIILIDKQFWKGLNNNDKISEKANLEDCSVLLKDKESIENNLLDAFNK